MSKFGPAGFEDDSSDEDGFSFGGDGFTKSRNSSMNIQSTDTSHSASDSRGGFGKPPPRSQPFRIPQNANQNSTNASTKSRWGEKDQTSSRSKPIHNRDDQKSARSNRQMQDTNKADDKISQGHNPQNWLQPDAIPIDDFRAAVIRNNVDAVKYYLDHGIEVDTVFSTEWTALMYASNYSLLDIMKLLIDRGANVNFHKDLYTVLMAACTSNNSSEKEGDILKAVQVLLDNGADINAFDRHHVSPLLYATRKGRVSVVKQLIEAGADKDKQDTKGYTALMLAAHQGNLHLIHVLLEAGADQNKQATDSSRAVDIAAINGHRQAEELLKSKNNPDKTVNIEDMLKTSTPQPLTNGNPSMFDLQGGAARDLHKFGDLELFLSGLEVPQLIPLFRDNEIDFKDFLRFTDKDLRDLGVSSMGVRKKILDAIRDTHKKTWETTSIAPIQYNKKITCAEAVAMVGNIKKHASYIGSSIGYISDQIKADCDILGNAQEGSGGEELSIQSEEAITNVKFLYEELVQLRSFLTEAAHRPEFKPPDLIKLKETNLKSSQMGSSLKVILTTSAVCAILYYKQELFFNGLNFVRSKVFPSS